MNVGIVTNGGDVPGLNVAVLEAHRSLRDEGLNPCGIQSGWDGLLALAAGAALPDVCVPLDLPSTHMRAHERVGGSLLGSSRATLEDPGVRSRVVASCRRERLEALIVIGGDGTLTSAADLHREGLLVVGVPKTIDNDIPATPVSLGFATAAVLAAEMLDAADDTGRTHRRHMVVELMGRGSGALTLRAAVSSGVPAVLPEAPFGPEAAERLLNMSHAGAIAVAEGSFGWPAGEEGPAPGSAARKVVELLRAAGGPESRVVVPGHLLRGAQPSPSDRWLGRMFGRVAAAQVLSETSCLLASDGVQVWQEDLDRAYEPPSPARMEDVRGAGRLVAA